MLRLEIRCSLVKKIEKLIRHHKHLNYHFASGTVTIGLIAKDELNLRRTLKVLTENCLPNMNKAQLTNALQLEMKINANIVRIEKEWAKAQFYDAILLFRSTLKKAMLK
jgi:hypothetical protein